MPKLSEEGQFQVKEKLSNIEIPNIQLGKISANKLSMLATKVILEEVVWDIKQNNNLVTLEKLNQDDRLNIDFSQIRPLGLSDDQKRSLSQDQIDELWKNNCIIGDGVSKRTASNFLKRQNIKNENACKYFCESLDIPYRKVIESDNLLDPIQLALKEFDHSQEFDDFGEKLMKYQKKIPLIYQLANNSYLSLNWWLRRCLSHEQNFKNCETLYINFALQLTQKLSTENLKKQLIQQTRGEIIWSSYDPEISEIGKVLARQILFKKNVVLVFQSGWQIDMILEFWQQLIQHLPPFKNTDHCLLLLFIADNQNISNNKIFHEIITPPNFDEFDVSSWLSQVKNLLNLRNDEQVKEKYKNIWKNSQTGQPEALLQAIYENFNYKGFANKKDTDYNRKTY